MINKPTRTKITVTIKALFHIPTWALIFLTLAAAGALLTDLYIFLSLDSLTSITVNNIPYLRGTEEFASELRVMKRSILLSALLAIVVGTIAARTIYLRKTTPHSSR